MESVPSLPECKCCDSIELSLVCEAPKPTWKELFWRESETCPEWYAERQRESHREFWTAHYGSDDYDWYLETQVEVAKETGPEPAKAIQMYLPGLTPGVSFEIESF
ncbi:hypothetical protein [Stieleria varia]|uniref:Uncharacterized protein n=1 Tax=Stieleria varia TaxID=2528005 RepID=A0A5C6AS75_9BACT|nr:hypothetical protein [Stieleria varia]TWU01024.1 hypothetical protein Pla52n_43950 [Stieleria varia]